MFSLMQLLPHEAITSPSNEDNDVYAHINESNRKKCGHFCIKTKLSF